MIERIDAARDKYFRLMFSDWPPQDVEELTRLLRRFADGWNKGMPRLSKDEPTQVGE
jgi:hypothetical protein